VPFTLDAPASGPSDEVDPLAWVTATASIVCWLRTSTLVVFEGGVVVVDVDVPVPAPDDAAALCPPGILGALLTNVPAEVRLAMLGLPDVVAAAPAPVANAKAIAAASDAEDRWRIAISCVVP